MDNDAGRFIQEFFDCENIHMYFKNLDKSKPNVYVVDIKKVD